MFPLINRNGSPRKLQRKQRPRLQPRLEGLEGRALLSQVGVNSVIDVSGLSTTQPVGNGNAIRQLTVSAGATPASGTAPLTVAFTSAASGGTAPYSYAWKFGDGSAGTGANPSHTYTSAGAYTATITATDSKGRTASSSVSVTVADTTPPSLPPPISGTNYQLAWDDEFDGTSVDTSKWNEVGPWGGPVSSTASNFSYSPSNVSEANGVATITAKQSGGNWTGGILSTDTTKTFQYGFFEIRAQIPSGAGFWPAIWLYGNSGAPEIDIMESIGDASTAYQTYHFPGGQHGSQANNLSPGYHLFQVLWEPGKITFYVDNVETGSWTDNVPSDPMFLMLNFDVGGPGDWSGAPDGSTPSPATFNINYVRVYQQS